ncbi:transcriptional repressor [Saccharopolyspora gregorii]|uniref:transcriptional repressor n=1 Tax=Saccharopolyspora gregorii TaxID=33914 RepID=UPI0031EA44AC
MPPGAGHRARALNITTIYRALTCWRRSGWCATPTSGTATPTYSADEHEHVHLVCHRCGEIDEVPCACSTTSRSCCGGGAGFRAGRHAPGAVGDVPRVPRPEGAGHPERAVEETR